MHGEMERLNAALAALGGLGGPEGKAKRSLAPQRAEAYVIGRSQENRSGAASPLGEMEEKQANRVNGKERAKRIL
jgi:hypothetical protein